MLHEEPLIISGLFCFVTVFVTNRLGSKLPLPDIFVKLTHITKIAKIP